MSQWRSTKARRVLAALLRKGWLLKRQSGSHRMLSRPGSGLRDRTPFGVRSITTLLGGFDWLPGDGGVEDIGVKIGSIRPDDGSKLGINANFEKILAVAQPGKHALESNVPANIDHALDAILEAEEQLVALQRTNFDDVL